MAVRCQHMALLLAASHAHRPCQPASPICRATRAGADTTLSPGAEHPAPFRISGHMFCLCHVLQTLFTSTG